MKRTLYLGLASTILVLGAVTTASATMITGNVDTTGTAGVSATAIDFYQVPPACATGPNPGTTGCFLTGAATGSFASASMMSGIVKDLTTPGAPVPAFMTFSNGVTFDLVSTPFAGLPDCSTVNQTQGGVTCVPGTSPFRLTNGPGPNPDGSGVAQSVSVQFTVNVNGYIGTAASGTTPYTGIYTTQISGETIADVLATLVSNNGTGVVVHAYSASFAPTSATPEPASIALMGFGLVAVAAAGRRYSRRKA